MSLKDKTGQVIPVHVVTSHGESHHLHALLTSALGFRLGRSILRERAHGTGWIGGWVDLITGLDTSPKKKIFLPCRESNQTFLVVQRTE
jgi:hypothetical protein